MIDLHCHYLPGIDDGARDLAEALTLARAAVDNGVRCAIMTPHLHPGRWENLAGAIQRHTLLFRRALSEAEIPLQVGYAAEVRMSPEIPLLIERGHVPFLGELDGYRLMLLEFPHGHLPLGADKLVWRLLQMKVRPVIAHPERNKEVMRDPARMAPFIKMGCILQLTAASVCGRFGERAYHTACQLLESDAELVLATDAHNSQARPPVLREGMEAIARIAGDAKAREMSIDLPGRIVASQFAPAGDSGAGKKPVVKRPTVQAAKNPLEKRRPAPAPQARIAASTGAERETGSRAAREKPRSLEDLLMHIIDQRLQFLLARGAAENGDDASMDSADAYHRELCRQLGGEIYSRVRREVLGEITEGSGTNSRAGKSTGKVRP